MPRPKRSNSGIKFGAEELFNLDAVAAQSQQNHDDDTEQREPARRPFGGGGHSAKNTTTQQQQQQQQQQLSLPAEARLPRWSFVCKNIFNHTHPTLLAEALDRIERWRRMTAAHGMLIRLRKIPSYIEATKVLVEAMQADRLLEKSRSEFWRDSEATVGPNNNDDSENNNNPSSSDDDDGHDDCSDDDDDGEEGGQDKSATRPTNKKNNNNMTTNKNNSTAPNVMLSLPALLATSTLPMIYASAVSRAVFEMTESSRKYSDQQDSTFRQRAQAIALPEEMTEARNAIAHGRMPTLAQLRFAASLGLNYLARSHWQPRAESLREYREQEERKNQRKQEKKPRDENVASPLPVVGGARRQRQEERGATSGVGSQQQMPQKKQKQSSSSFSSSQPQSQQQQQQRQPMLSLEELQSKVGGLLNPKQ